MNECHHDDCGSLVAYDKVHAHRMECLHGPCAYMKPDCDFAASPIALVIHLRETHSIRVGRSDYDINTRHIISHANGTVFVVLIGKRGMGAVVSFVCVRSMACTRPWYKVKICARSTWQQESLGIEFPADKLKAVVVIEPTSSPLSGTSTFEEVTSFLVVPQRYLTRFEPSKKLCFSYRIDK
jgi:hypothetical protein